MRAGKVDPCVEEVRRKLDRARQQLLGLAVVLGLHGNQGEQAHGLDVPRIAPQDFAVRRFGLLETARALVRSRLRDQLARRVGAQENLHRAFGLEGAARLRQRMNERQLRALQLGVECERLLQAFDGVIGAAELQEAPAELLVRLGIAGLFRKRAAQFRLGFRRAALAIQGRAEQRQEIRLARDIPRARRDRASPP